jgi:hypothetical protein
MVCLPKEEVDAFKKAHQKLQKNVTEVNLGDSLMYKDPNN